MSYYSTMSVRQRQYDQLLQTREAAGHPIAQHSYYAFSELNSAARKKLSKSSFAIPERRAYPIPDESHARNALARVAQHGTPEEQRRVRAAVHRKFPNIGKK